MTGNTEDAISDITAKIFESGTLQKSIKDGSLVGLTFSILGDEDAWSLDFYLHFEGRNSAEFINEEEDDLLWGIQELIEEQLEEGFEEIGFFANERENIYLNLVLRS